MSNVSLPPEPHLTQASNTHNDVLTHTGDMPKTARIATHTEPTPRTIRTTCPYCGVGCGVLASIDDAGSISVTGDPEHPANFGKLCSKGSALAQTLGAERRLLEPYYQNKLISMSQAPYIRSTDHSDNADNTIPATDPTEWDVVLEDIGSRLSKTIAEHGRDSVMFYVSGQLLTEDYYVANKLIKGFIGNNNIDSNSRLCMSSAVAGHKRAFGADLVPSNYKDLESCDLLVLVGSNMAWCHPILFGRFLSAKKTNPNKKLIVIDPRRTDSCEFADLHLPISAGTDTHLYNGLLHYLNQQGCADKSYAGQCHDVDLALDAAQTWTIDKVAQACKVSTDLVRQFYELVAANDKTVTAFSMGVNQSRSGTDKVNAIINTHLLTGRVGKVGASPFSLTGQPNAMGGREVGALANLLAAHLDLSNRDHRQLAAEFWQAPQPIAAEVGVKACDAAEAILSGRIKAIWIMATNPVVSLPEADKFRRALAHCDLVIVSDCSVDSDTVKCADIVLPAQGWGEKSGTVTNSERRISRQRALMPALGQAKPDWWILSQVAKRMGFSGFDYQHASEIFNEHVALTAYKNDFSQAVSKNNQPRHLNLATALSRFSVESMRQSYVRQDHMRQDHDSEQPKQASQLSPEVYDAMGPFQWGGERIAPIEAYLVAIVPSDNASLPNKHTYRLKPRGNDNREEFSKRDQEYDNAYGNEYGHTVNSVPLRLNTGRLRDQWHTMTRTGLAPQLNQHQSVPTLTMHPDDAQQLGVESGSYVRLCPRYVPSPTGTHQSEQNQSYSKDAAVSVTSVKSSAENPSIDSIVLAQIAISDSMSAGDGFMPMHWSDAFASFARVGTLIPTAVDPHSGQPELKNTAVNVTPVPMKAYGKILVHPDLQDAMIVHLKTLLHDVGTSSVLPALTWSRSRQKNSVLITLASPIDSVVEQLLEPDYWQQFIDTHSLSVSTSATTEASNNASVDSYDYDDTLTVNSAFTMNKSGGQLRFISTQSTGNEALASKLMDVSATTSQSERLLMSVCLAVQATQLPSVHWLDGCFASTDSIPESRRYKWLLAGRPATGYIDPGLLVCSCMAVGENTIIHAITKQQCTSANAVGKACRAGTNCGSCVSQINTLIERHAS